MKNTEKWRQLLHIEPPDGWLNDPNGLCVLNNIYHVYFQYSPKSPKGESPRCWGHYSGNDLASLKYDNIVLKPDISEDRSGVYSGCAVIDDNKIHIFYTGNVKEDGNHDYIKSGRQANVIHVVSDDGFKMQEKQIVLRNEDYPKFCSCHVRDPKIWKENNIWKMVLGARTLENKGCVLIYESKNLNKWEYVTTVFTPDFGYMWECPDYFKIADKGFLSISPQGLKHYEDRFQNVYQSGYFTVCNKLEDNEFGEFVEWDMGFDFYAPQTFETPDKRRILIGWMGIGDTDYTNPTIELGWNHCLTLPRELTLDGNGKILQNPIHEILEKFESKKISINDNAKINLPFLLMAKTDGDFTIDFDNNLKLEYNSEEKLFTMKFLNAEYGGGRTVRKARIKQCENIRIIADMSSLEIYLNSGETVMSTRFYPDEDEIKISTSGNIEAEYSSFISKE